jgi:hypothetical protein
VGESLPAYRGGNGFWAIVVRTGTPATVLNKLNTDIVKALQASDVRTRLAAADIEIVGARPGECDAFLGEQVAAWGAIVKTPARGPTEGVKGHASWVMRLFRSERRDVDGDRGRRFHLRPGDFVWTGVGACHTFEQTGAEPFRWIDPGATVSRQRHTQLRRVGEVQRRLLERSQTCNRRSG